jgi:hypothetical protein
VHKRQHRGEIVPSSRSRRSCSIWSGLLSR